MRVTSDIDSMPTGSGPKFVERILCDGSLGANSMTLEVDGFTIRFDGIHSGSAMLFREDSVAGKRFVAFDAYDQDRIRAFVKLFDSNPSAMIESINWEEDEVSTWGLVPALFVAVLIAIVAFWIYRHNLT